jgi:hypothetical protein
VSSLVRSIASGTAICALALTFAACGSDSEPSTTEVADRLTTPTTADTSPTETTDTAALERAEARRHAAARKAARKRAEARRKKRAEAREARRAERERLAAEKRRQEAAAQEEAERQAAEQAAAEEAERQRQQQAAAPQPHQVTETANLRLVSKKGVAFVHEGSVSGTLNGTMRLDARLGGKGVEGTFVVTLPDGTLTGSASAALALKGAFADFKGTATISRGTGAYKKLQPTQVAFNGSVKSDASSSTVKLSGTINW